MRVEFSPLVELDLDVIFTYIARHNRTRAFTFVGEIRSEFLRIAQNPTVYRLRPEIRANIRVSTIGRYLIFFWVEGDVVRIRRVLHGARNLARLSI